jgi:hypothetical protein
MTPEQIVIAGQAVLNAVLVAGGFYLLGRCWRSEEAAESWRRDYEWLRASAGRPAADETGTCQGWPGMYGH